MLRAGEKIGQREELLGRLVAMQYERNDVEFVRGTFRVRGEVIDVFPAESAELAVRITLFDDEVESLEMFDPLTGKIKQKIPRFTVYPSSPLRDAARNRLAGNRNHQGGTARTPGFFWWPTASWSRRSGSSSVPVSIWKCCRNWGFAKGSKTIRAICRARRPGEPPPTLIDYLPADALMLIDESHVTHRAA